MLHTARRWTMPKNILLVSQDVGLLDTRALVLHSAGHRTVKTTSLERAVHLSFGLQMAIIDYTFSPEQHQMFIERVREASPSMFVLSIRVGLFHPAALLSAIDGCFSSQRSSSKVCVVRDNENVIAWPKKAS
jgi:hypothetical protein